MQKLSEQLLLAVKMQQPTADLVNELSRCSPSQLNSVFVSDVTKKAFWINIYNAFFLVLKREKKLQKPAIFREKQISIAGILFSLDEIEHGILRKYRWKWSLGYLPNPFASKVIRRLAVQKIDPRIHFALNCGAKSCPPIAFYKSENLEQQLDLASHSFLESETDLFPEKKEVHTSRLFLWFKADFGGQEGSLRFLEKYLNLDLTGWKLVYKPYDWGEELGNFVENA